jgi:hypothetical protein
MMLSRSRVERASGYMDNARASLTSRELEQQQQRTRNSQAPCHADNFTAPAFSNRFAQIHAIANNLLRVT